MGAEALGVLETIGLTPALGAIDRMEKTAAVRVVECEWNDMLGVVIKLAGPLAAVEAAIAAGRATAEQLAGQPVATVFANPEEAAEPGIRSPRTYNPLIEQDVVFFPEATKERFMDDVPAALGIIETQGFTAVFAAIDAACKTANVAVVGKEKLGGGYVAVIVRGELSAVHAAIAAGRQRVEGLGKLIAAEVIARPSESVLGLLPK